MGGNLIHSGIKSERSRTIVVGASGEIGGAIARIIAGRGGDLLLWGRDAGRLELIAAECRASGAASANVCAIDLENLPAASAALAEADDVQATDILVIASGLGDVRAAGDLVESAEIVDRLGRVNFLAPTVLATAMARRMIARRKGRIVLIGSAAAFHPLPFSIAYSASKAGLARFSDALRIACAPHGVGITLASPGFVDTAAARTVPGKKPFLISPDEAARRIIAAADRNAAHLVTPWSFKLLRAVERALPRALSDRLLRSLAPDPCPPED